MGGVLSVCVEDLSVLISGSSRGIGFEVAKAFLASGAYVILSSHDEKELEAAYNLAKAEFGDKVGAVVCDVCKPESCVRAVSDAIEKFGKLDTVICNAGIDIIKSVQDYSEKEWDKILDVNLKGAFHFSQAAIQHFLSEGKKGSIIYTSSIASSIGIAGLVPYSASKGGINQLVRSMAVELAANNIRVNAVAPGYVENIMAGVSVHETPEENERIKRLTPMGRRCSPKELAGAYIYLASEAASYVTGHVLYVDGGYSAL